VVPSLGPFSLSDILIQFHIEVLFVDGLPVLQYIYVIDGPLIAPILLKDSMVGSHTVSVQKFEKEFAAVQHLSIQLLERLLSVISIMENNECCAHRPSLSIEINAL